MSSEDVGQVQSDLFSLYTSFNLFTGCTSSSAWKLDLISQIVCFPFKLYYQLESINLTPQHRLLLWRPLLTDCTSFHSISNLTHRIPWQASICFITLDPCSSIFVDPAYWCERPDFFATIADAEPGQDRILAVLKWFISTLKDQYTSRNDQLGSEKKSAPCRPFFIPFLNTFRTQTLEPSSWRVRHFLSALLLQLSYVMCGAGFFMALGQIRTDVASLSSLWSRSHIIHPSLPTSSKINPKACGW